MCYTLEKQISENKEKLQGMDVASIEKLIKEGREAVEKQDDAKVASALEALEKEAHAMAAKLYEGVGGAPGGAPGAGPDAGPPPGDEGGKKKKGGDVIDAEFEESN
jgi:molecular chaperone DnaK